MNCSKKTVRRIKDNFKRGVPPFEIAKKLNMNVKDVIYILKRTYTVNPLADYEEICRKRKNIKKEIWEMECRITLELLHNPEFCK